MNRRPAGWRPERDPVRRPARISQVFVAGAGEDGAMAAAVRRAARDAGLDVAASAADADALVLLASPASAADRSVDGDVGRWAAGHHTDELVVFLLAGELVERADDGGFDRRTTALSPASQALFGRPPFHLDLRATAPAEAEARVRRALSALSGSTRPPASPAGPAPAPPAAPAPATATASRAPGTEVAPTPLGPPPLAARPAAASRRRTWSARPLLLVGALLVAVAVLGGLVLASGPGDDPSSPTGRPSSEPPDRSEPPTSDTLPAPQPDTTDQAAGPPDDGEAPGTDRLPSLLPLLGVALAAMVVGLLVGRRWRSDRRAGWDPHRSRPPSPAPVTAGPERTDGGGRPRPHVFVSHDRGRDAVLAHRLADDLADLADIWIAPESIPAGDDWLWVLDDGLRRSSTFLVLLSRAALASRWVRKELQAAMQLEIAHGRPRLLPLEIEACNLPALLRTYQLISLLTTPYDTALAQVRRAVTHGGPDDPTSGLDGR